METKHTKLTYLQSSTNYYYRTASVEIVEYGAYNVVYGNTIYSDVYSFMTLSPGISQFSFISFNDVNDQGRSTCNRVDFADNKLEVRLISTQNGEVIEMFVLE